MYAIFLQKALYILVKMFKRLNVGIATFEPHTSAFPLWCIGPDQYLSHTLEQLRCRCCAAMRVWTAGLLWDVPDIVSAHTMANIATPFWRCCVLALQRWDTDDADHEVDRVVGLKDFVVETLSNTLCSSSCVNFLAIFSVHCIHSQWNTVQWIKKNNGRSLTMSIRGELIVTGKLTSSLRFVLLLSMSATVTFATIDQRFPTDKRKFYCARG